MPEALIEDLISLQDCDSRYQTVRNQLDRLPLEIIDIQSRIEAEKQSMIAESDSLKKLEVDRHAKDVEVQAVNEQVSRYKTQQLQVKKNEEYRALQHEIDTLVKKIASVEDLELELMMEIDEMREANMKARAEHEKAIEDFTAIVKQLEDNIRSSRDELETVEIQLHTARSKLDSGILKKYEYVSSQVKRPPYVVPLRDGRCGGCYLRVSNEVQGSAKKPADLTRCDHCGRIVYFAPAL